MSQLQRAEVRFVVVDLRTASGPAEDGYYYESWEGDLYPYEGGVPLPRLTKFNDGAGFDLVYDNGSIQIFDTGIGAEPMSATEGTETVGSSLWLVALRASFWLPMVFIGLGLLVLRARRIPRLHMTEDTGLAIAVSLATGIVVVLMVGVSPIPIGTRSLMIVFVALIAVLTAATRRQEPRPVPVPQLTRPVGESRRRAALTVVASTLAVVAILGVALGSVRADSIEHAGELTELGIQVVDDQVVVTAELRRAPARPSNIVVRVDGEVLSDSLVNLDAEGERVMLDIPGGARSASAEVIDPATGESLLRTAITLTADQTIADVFARTASA